MSPEITGFALGLLVGAAKVLGIGMAGFAVAWWRARLRIKALESELEEAQTALDAMSASRSLPPGPDAE